MVRFFIPFSSVKATFSSSRGGKVSLKSLRRISEFFILAIKISRIHSSSPADMWHFFAISARTPQNCSNDSLSLCFLIKKLCLSNVTFVFLTKATDSFFHNFFVKKKLEDFYSRDFLAKNLFSFVSEGYRIDQSFLSASSNLMPLNRFVSVIIEAVSLSSNLVCSRIFV